METITTPEDAQAQSTIDLIEQQRQKLRENDKEVLEQVSHAVRQEPVTFTIEVVPKNWLHALLIRLGVQKKKRAFTIKPLTIFQLHAVSEHLLPINLKNLTPDSVLENILKYGSRALANVVAVSVTESRGTPSKELVDMFFRSISVQDYEILVRAVLQQMHLQNFISSIALIRNLDILAVSPASVNGAEKTGANP